MADHLQFSVGGMPTAYKELETQGPVCQYWNSTISEWTTEGVTISRIRCTNYSDQSGSRYCYGGTVTCETSHLSSFVAKTGALPEYNTVDPFGGYSTVPDVVDNWLVLVALGSVYLSYFIALAWGIQKDKAMAKRLRRCNCTH